MKLCDSIGLEKLHVQFCKYLLGVGKKATNAAAKSELGRHAVLPELLAHSVKFWLRLCEHDQSSLVYKAYLDMHEDARDRNHENWVTRVRSLLTEFRMPGVWENQGSLYKHKTVRTLKGIMLDRYEHNWLAYVGLSPTFSTPGTKLRTYIQFKHSIGLENYVIAIKSFKKRQSMAKLRISAHPLRIETGRYCRPPTPADQRVCQFCNSGAVENEDHFILSCSIYSDERKKLFDSLVGICPNLLQLDHRELFNFIMSCNNGDSEIIEHVCLYVSECFEKRNNYIQS